MQVQTGKDVQSKLVSKENRCYICKRTEVEVQEFLMPNLDEITERYDSELANLESKLKNKKDSLKSYLDDILKSTEKANLDFKIETAINDLDSFKKIIPNTEYLFEVGSNFRFGVYDASGKSCEYYLSDIRKKIVELRKEMEDDHFRFKIWKEKEWKIDRDTRYNNYEFHYRIHGVKEFEIGNEEIEEMLENLENVHKKRDTHLASVKYQNKVINEIKHRKIIREIKSSVEYPEYEIKLKDGCTAYRRRPKDSYETQFSFDICAICNTLVWHRTDYAIDSEFHDKSPPPLESGEAIVSLAPDSRNRRL